MSLINNPAFRQQRKPSGKFGAIKDVGSGSLEELSERTGMTHRSDSISLRSLENLLHVRKWVLASSGGFHEVLPKLNECPLSVFQYAVLPRSRLRETGRLRLEMP